MRKMSARQPLLKDMGKENTKGRNYRTEDKR
jgi:hypothetical protein